MAHHRELWLVRKVGSKIGGRNTKNETNNHEDDDGSELQNRRPEFFFCETEDTEDVYEDDGEEEDCDPYTNIHLFVPIGYCETCDYEFERKNDGPLEDVV